MRLWILSCDFLYAAFMDAECMPLCVLCVWIYICTCMGPCVPVLEVLAVKWNTDMMALCWGRQGRRARKREGVSEVWAAAGGRGLGFSHQPWRFQWKHLVLIGWHFVKVCGGSVKEPLPDHQSSVLPFSHSGHFLICPLQNLTLGSFYVGSWWPVAHALPGTEIVQGEALLVLLKPENYSSSLGWSMGSEQGPQPRRAREEQAQLNRELVLPGHGVFTVDVQESPGALSPRFRESGRLWVARKRESMVWPRNCVSSVMVRKSEKQRDRMICFGTGAGSGSPEPGTRVSCWNNSGQGSQLLCSLIF